MELEDRKEVAPMKKKMVVIKRIMVSRAGKDGTRTKEERFISPTPMKSDRLYHDSHDGPSCQKKT